MRANTDDSGWRCCVCVCVCAEGGAALVQRQAHTTPHHTTPHHTTPHHTTPHHLSHHLSHQTTPADSVLPAV
jgi:hypothetical protein